MAQAMDRCRITVDTDGLEVCVMPGPCGSAEVTLCGEVDLHNAADVREALVTALTTYRGALTVDLCQVTFCDCAGLNALLAARNAADRAHRSLRVTIASRTVDRLFELTGTRSCLT
ncbi:STAS domain-containing protein [Streptomyces sp. NPDC058646]|uniref:STAS domain-containing protein n=1 Tax=Streptomyces sp. NPDC058646 TaxID=3346574 RepID=UPI00365C840C